MCSIKAEEKSIDVSINIDKNLPFFAMGDVFRFKQIIINLLTNAIKFTPTKGTITISVTRNESTDLRLEIKDNALIFDGDVTQAKVIFTGMIDELFDDKFGEMPYRSIDLEFEVVDKAYYQDHAVVNYPNEHNYTRITEFKHIHPASTNKTTILKEYPQEYKRDINTPYYPMFTEENQIKYDRYAAYAKQIPNLLLIGRLAEYEYYDMDDIIARALEVFNDIIVL